MIWTDENIGWATGVWWRWVVLDASKIFCVKVNNRDCDIVSEESNDVGRQGEKVDELPVVDSVVSSTECIPNEMRRCIFINRLW